MLSLKGYYREVGESTTASQVRLLPYDSEYHFFMVHWLSLCAKLKDLKKAKEVPKLVFTDALLRCAPENVVEAVQNRLFKYYIGFYAKNSLSALLYYLDKRDTDDFMRILEYFREDLMPTCVTDIPWSIADYADVTGIKQVQFFASESGGEHLPKEQDNADEIAKVFLLSDQKKRVFNKIFVGFIENMHRLYLTTTKQFYEELSESRSFQKISEFSGDAIVLALMTDVLALYFEEYSPKGELDLNYLINFIYSRRDFYE